VILDVVPPLNPVREPSDRPQSAQRPANPRPGGYLKLSTVTRHHLDVALRRYEALHAFYGDGLTCAETAERFGYTPADRW
jgi:hypothetical protein